MSLVNTIYLYAVVTIFTAFPVMLFVAWVATKGWRSEPQTANRPPAGEETAGARRAA